LQLPSTRTFIVMGLLLLLSGAAITQTVDAEEIAFSLGIGQAVTVGEYIVVFAGATGTLPHYNVYRGSALVAHLPVDSGGPPKYAYANVDIRTTGLAAGGTAATGIIIVR